MGVVVQFNVVKWRELFPQFNNITSEQITDLIYPIATAYCNNSGSGPVNDTNIQTQLLNLMVAHIAQLLFGSTTAPANTTLVGRINSAGEGSVNVGTDFPTTPSNAWFVQTQYGAAYWQMVLPYRLGHYYPKITQLTQYPFSWPV